METHYEINNGVVTFTRLFNAPREMVWEAWTNPELLKKWWGPDGFSLTIHSMELSPEGTWRFTMHGPDDRDYPNLIQFIEVTKPEKLVYRHMDDDESESISFHVTITFTEVGNATRVIMRSDFGSDDELNRVNEEYGAIEGGVQHLNRLAEILKVQSTKF